MTKIADAGSNTPALVQKALAIIDELLGAEEANVRGGADVEYVVEQSVNGMVLTEHRTGGRTHPFRCPQPVYEAMVKVMSEADRAVPLDELVAALAEVLGDRPPDYQVRVALRLWMHLDPQLVNRNRARYRPSTAKFASDAKKVWSDLKSRP